MSSRIGVTLAFVVFFITLSASAQQFDVAFGVSGVNAPSSSDASGDHSPQTVGGGTFLGFSGDYLFFHNFGVNGEVNWRAGQNSYAISQQPFRPIFFDFNGIWVPRVSDRVQPELKAGLGVESVRFYQPFFVCQSIFGGCTDYTSTNHFMGDFGAAVRLYVWHHVFVRPEAQVYLIHNNLEFSSGHAARFGVSIGYTFRSEY